MSAVNPNDPSPTNALTIVFDLPVDATTLDPTLFEANGAQAANVSQVDAVTITIGTSGFPSWNTGDSWDLISAWPAVTFPASGTITP